MNFLTIFAISLAVLIVQETVPVAGQISCYSGFSSNASQTAINLVSCPPRQCLRVEMTYAWDVDMSDPLYSVVLMACQPFCDAEYLKDTEISSIFNGFTSNTGGLSQIKGLAAYCCATNGCNNQTIQAPVETNEVNTGPTVQATCGNNITISVEGTDGFPVDINNTDTRSNATGLVAGFTEYCDVNGLAPEAKCMFTEHSKTHSLVISDFSSCGVTSQYIADDDVTEVTVLVSRIPYVNSSMTAIRRSECGRFAVICRYNKTLENVTYDTSLNITTSDYIGVNATVNSTTEMELHLITESGAGSAPGVDISNGTTYNLTETIHVEARMVNNTDKFVSTLKNCYASTERSYNKDYMLIGRDGCANPVDGTIQVDNGTTPTTPRYFPYFDFQAFIWTSLDTRIYIQCEIEMCLEDDEICISSMTKCSSSKLLNRYRRNTENLKTTTIKSGAINVQKVNVVRSTLIGNKV